MKKLIIFILLPILTHAQLTVINGELEGFPPQAGVVPFPWTTCMPIVGGGFCTPDTQPGVWGITTPPSEGTSYAGIAHRTSDGWQEGFSQELSSPMIANGCSYVFTVDLANAITADSWASGGPMIYTTYAEVRVFGGFDYCSEQELLWSSGSIEHETWETYTVEFTPSANYSHILFECFKTEPNLESGYMLIDNITPIFSNYLPADAGPNQTICMDSNNENFIRS